MKKFLLPILFGAFLSSCDDGAVLQSYPTIQLDQLPVPAAAVGRKLTAVDFVSSTQGFVGGEGGLLLMTTDGGQTWATRTAPGSGTINKLLFTSATAGWAATSTALYKTTDGAQTWQNVYVYTYPTSEFRDLQFVTPQVGYLLERSGVYRTANGGSTWNRLNSYNWSNFLNLSAMSFSAADSGLVVGADNFQYRTSNGGQTWTPSTQLYTYAYTSLIRRRNGSVVAVANDFYDVSLAGGYTNSQRTYPYDSAPLYALARWQDRIVAVGQKSVVKRLPGFAPKDEATDWIRMQGPRGQELPGIYRSADFADADTFYAVGDDGLITRFHY